MVMTARVDVTGREKKNMSELLSRRVVALLLMLISHSAAAESFSVGIVPQHSPKKLAEAWQPLLSYIGSETGHTFHFETAKDIPTFEKALSEGKYDIAYMNPYHFVVFHKNPGYRALVRQKDQTIQGIIVVPHDSPFTELSDLNGTKIAFPAPAAFAASIIPRATMQKEGINFTPVYVHSHDSVYLNVKRGFFKAGGGIYRSLQATDDDVKENLKVLWASPAYTPHAIATHPRLSEEVRGQLLNVLTTMNPGGKGSDALNSLKMKGFSEAFSADWDDIRALNIDLLQQENP